MRLLCVALAGCVTSLAGGAQTIATTSGTASAELAGTAALGVPLGDHEALLARIDGSIGASTAGLEGTALSGYQYIHYGAWRGWQAAIDAGGRFGSPDGGNFVVQASGGPNWVLGARNTWGRLLALDFTIGYAFRLSSLARAPGVLFGVALTFRHDRLIVPNLPR
jgi:hypothetical protein